MSSKDSAQTVQISILAECMNDDKFSLTACMNLWKNMNNVCPIRPLIYTPLPHRLEACLWWFNMKIEEDLGLLLAGTILIVNIQAS